MTMTIMNNTAAVMSLGELNKNISQVGKQLKKLSSGMRINSAGDDASGYSISEKMRVRIRALKQNERNVQNGSALLRVAEGGVQSQLEIMRTIKEKVIDADNDTNTDLDRATIQKEIDQGFRQIEDIAWETTYNGKHLLVGDRVGERVYSWVVDDKSSLLPGSDAMKMIDMNMIDDKYESLNGIVGPFDLFTPSKIESATLDSVGFSPYIQFKGGGEYTYTIDNSFTTVDSLDGAAFVITSQGGYILRKSPSSDHRYGAVYPEFTYDNSDVKEIDIGGCTSVQDVMAAIKEQVSGDVVTGYGVDANGANYFTCKNNVGYLVSYRAYDVTIAGAGEIPGFSGTANFSGGTDEYGDPNVDSQHHDATTATFSVTNIVADTGITVEDYGDIYRIRFTEGNGKPFSSNGVTTIGTDYIGTFEFKNFKGELENGTLKLEAKQAGSNGNGYSVTSGIEETVLKYWGQESRLRGTLLNNDAYAVLDVSSYTNVEDLIGDLQGKAIAQRIGYSDESPSFGNRAPYDADYNYDYYEFVDSASDNPIDGTYKIASSYVFDLNRVRTEVAGGKSIAEAFSDLCEGTTTRAGGSVVKATDSSGQTIGIKFKAILNGNTGNNERLFLAKGQLRSYTLDYGQWFADNPDISVPEFLHDKGFRAYCASCDNQWFNFHFITEDLPEGRPQNSDPDSEDIKHIYIDVSGVTDAKSLVQAIYDQATPQLTGADPDLNHFMRLIADGEKLIIYDERRYTDAYLKNVRGSNGEFLYEYQWDDAEGVGGAKIADGVWDNVSIGERDIYVRDLIIQDTDHASMNIRLRIPQTTMDHLFGYQAGTRDLSEFNVLTAKSREELLGNKAGKSRSGKIIPKDEKGLLDTAIDYLTNANTLIGAQNMRLGMTESNIVVQHENTTASESTIRDADMAKEMAEYTKASVLSQASQSMLAQANQNGSAILSLLQ